MLFQTTSIQSPRNALVQSRSPCLCTQELLQPTNRKALGYSPAISDLTCKKRLNGRCTTLSTGRTTVGAVSKPRPLMERTRSTGAGFNSRWLPASVPNGLGKMLCTLRDVRHKIGSRRIGYPPPSFSRFGCPKVLPVLLSFGFRVSRPPPNLILQRRRDQLQL